MEQRYQLKKPVSIKRRKRIGCGNSSGHGKTSCRGTKGYGSRSGSKTRAGFEGGQMPLQRRIPKRGFNNIFKKEFQLITVSMLDKISTSEITPLLLCEKGLINDDNRLIKVLGNGDIKNPIKITADAFSKSALEKIKKAGGEIILRGNAE